MKKGSMLMLGLTFAMAPAVLVACDPKEATVEKVSTDYFKQTYYKDETIDFSAVKLNVELSDGSKVTLENQGRIDTTFEDAGENPTFDFILKTDGLAKAITDDNVQMGHEYNISCILKQDKKTYKLATVVFRDDLSLVYDMTRFAAPEAIEEFKTLQASETEESKFMKKETKYYVGDDNGFKFAPRYTLVTKDEDAQVVSNVYLPVVAKVYKVEGQNKTLVTEGTDYTFDNLTYTFKFAETAVGNEYMLQLTPRDFTTYFNGSQVQPIEFNVTIADGYNVHNAYDLGHISVVGEEDITEVAKCSYTTYDKFWDEENHVYYTKAYYQAWNDFYKAKGETNLKTVNGIFLHGNIKVTANDIPSEFLVTADESTYAAGSLRDWILVYTHNLPDRNSEFTFNGNQFKIDLTELPVAKSHDEHGALTYYNGDASVIKLTNCVVFYFGGLHHDYTDQYDDFAQVTFKNVYATGASGKTITGQASEDAAGTPTFLKVENSTAVTLENSVINQFAMALNSSQKGDWLVKDTKVFDCYNTGLYVYVTEGRIENSQIKRLGGPAIFSVSDGSTQRPSNYTIDAKSEVENFVTADQTWFVLNSAQTLVQMFQYLSAPDTVGGLCQTGKTILNDAGKFNMQTLILDEDYLASDYTNLYATIDYDAVEAPALDYDAQKMQLVCDMARQYMASLNGVPVEYIPRPVIFGDQYGHFAISDGNDMLAYVTVTDWANPATGFQVQYTPVQFEGDYCYIYCPIPGGVATANMVVSMYDVQPAQA